MCRKHIGLHGITAILLVCMTLRHTAVLSMPDRGFHHESIGQLQYGLISQRKAAQAGADSGQQRKLHVQLFTIYFSAILRYTRQVCKARTLSVADRHIPGLMHTHVTSSLVKMKRIRITTATRLRSRPLRSALYTLFSWNERCRNLCRLCPAMTADEQVADHCIRIPAARRCAFAPAYSLKGLEWLTVPVQCCHMPS